MYFYLVYEIALRPCLLISANRLIISFTMTLLHFIYHILIMKAHISIYIYLGTSIFLLTHPLRPEHTVKKCRKFAIQKRKQFWSTFRFGGFAVGSTLREKLVQRLDDVNVRSNAPDEIEVN
jgi:hypothetical protein